MKSINPKLFVLFIAFLFSFSIQAQKDTITTAKPKHKKVGLTAFLPLTPVQDYTGKFGERATVTGNWGGTRQKLFDSGFMFDVSVTQSWQGVLAGGKTNQGAYYGLVDYAATLDLGKLGLWGKGILFLSAQTNFGSTDLMSASGTILPVNFLNIFPETETSRTFLMEYYLMQAFGKKVVLFAGRLNATNFLDKSWFANNPRTQFMNIGLNNTPLLGGFLSFSTYAILVDGTINKHFSIAGAFYDAAAAPGNYGVPGGLFNKWGVALDLGVSWNVKPEAERNGMVHISFLYTNKKSTDLDNPFLIKDAIKEALGGAPLPTVDGNSLMNITFNQYLWKPDTKKASDTDKKDDANKKKEVQTAAYGFNKRGMGLYARYAIGPDDRNIFNSFMSIGFGARGISDGRPYDRMGIGMYFFKKSDALNSIPTNLLQNETGFEAYYAAAITPSIQLGADIQYINSGISNVENPFVAGLRLMIQL